MFVTVDVQGFKAFDNRFIVKEIAVVLNDEEYHCFFLKEPFPIEELDKHDQRQTSWLQLYHHGIPWSYGSDSFKNVQQYMQKLLKNTTVFVKGAEKQQWMAEFLNQKIINIEDITNELNLSEWYKSVYPCQYHNNLIKSTYKKSRLFRCALKTAIILRNYIIFNSLYSE